MKYSKHEYESEDKGTDSAMDELENSDEEDMSDASNEDGSDEEAVTGEDEEEDSKPEDNGSDEDEGSSEVDDSNSEADKDGSEADAESGGDDDGANEGWADSMAKILKTNRPKGKKTLVLSKAKKISDVKKVKPKELGFEVIGEFKEEKPSVDELNIKQEDDEEPKIKKKREIGPEIRQKPNILEKEKEKALSKIATRGVVQLFNAVRNQQKDLEEKLEAAGPLERKKEKVIKSLNKTQFLDNLMGKSKSEIVNKTLKKEMKDEVKNEDSKWSVFRDDFMMGGKMKDWDKQDNQDSNEEGEISNLSDSE